MCITPGAGYLDTTGAVVCGALAGPTCFAACQLKKIFQFDDALDAFGIHGPGGILGGILTGFLAVRIPVYMGTYVLLYIHAPLYLCMYA